MNRATHVIQPHNVAGARVRAVCCQFLLLMPVSGSCEHSLWSQEPGIWDLWDLGRWAGGSIGAGFLMWWLSIRAWSLALSIHWLLALEEGGDGCLLGFYQLLQVLQHRQTQGLELHGQFDYFSLLLFF